MPRKKKYKKDIIFITVDSLRADHLSCYGSNYVKTPNIDKLAKDGFIFSNAFAGGSHTVTSVSSFLTSVPTPLVRREHLTIQEVLRRNGYKTIGLNPNVQIVYGFCSDLGLTRGFDRYDTLLGSSRERFEAQVEGFIGMAGGLTTHLFNNDSIFYKLISNVIGYIPLPIAKPAPRADEINQKGISVLKNSKQPVFLWLFYLDVHEPYMPQQKTCSFRNNLKSINVNRKLRYFRDNLTIEEVEELHKLYIGEIEQLDKEVGNLITELNENDLYDDTVIIFTADHGEQFGEHGGFGHGALYDEVISVPLIVKEDKKADSHKVEEIVSLLDLAPTIADIAGITNVETFSGESLRPLYNSNKRRTKPILCFADERGEQYCYRTKKWKIIFRKEKKGIISRTGGNELYNLGEDPLEKENVYHEYTETAKKLQNEAISYLNNFKNSNAKILEKRRIKKTIDKLRNI